MNLKVYLKDKDIQQLVGNLLRYGVLTSSFIVVLGGICYLYLFGDKSVPDYHSFNQPSEEIFAQLKGLNPSVLIIFGMMVLIATPILRVAFSLVAFALENDKTYIVITLIVLIIIIFNILYGFEG